MPRDFIAPSIEELAALLPAYEFEVLIAKGGMGAVYRAKQKSLARDVAVKVLPRDLGRDPDFRESFETEAHAMARLNHPNLIGVYDSGSVDGMLYIVMEYVPGKSLYHSSYGKQIDPEQAVALTQGICSGLHHAHENGIIHRDIKPSNVLLTPKVEPKIGDFGLARPVEKAGAGLVMGTPGYTAPEVVRHPEVADKRSDLYAVGVILYELLTGARQQPDSPPPSTLCGCGPTMDEIWRKATHADPAKRFQDADAFNAALSRWLTAYRKTQRPSGAPVRLKQGGGQAAPSGIPQVANMVPSATQTISYDTNANWHIVRNLFIIAALIIGIAFTWKKLEHARAVREIADAKRLEEEAELRAKADAEARERAQAAQKPGRPRGSGTTVTLPPAQPQPREETPLESLERLRRDLIAGKRDAMPKTAVRRADSDYMFVPEPMTWADAAAYAERFDAHLATPSSPDDLLWLERLPPGEGFAWLGAGRSGRNQWSLLGGGTWTITPEPRGTGGFAAVGRLGVKTFDAKAALPFVIQWSRDGSNPASLQATLQATRNSLGEANPVFPPGTREFDGRFFNYVSRECDYREASDLADGSGGHLAVISNETEAEAIADFINSQSAPEGVWLGGRCKNGEWTWITGEPWTVSKWHTRPAPSEDGLALVLKPGSGWEGLPAGDTVSGFVIEWSGDRKHAAPSAGVAALDGSALMSKARELVAAADAKRNEEFAANARKFAWDLDVWARTLSASEQSVWRPHLERLKGLVRNNRVPASVPKSTHISLSEKMAGLAAYYAAKQEQINGDFLANVNKIRLAYVAKLPAEIRNAENTGKAELANTLRTALAAAGDVPKWLDSMDLKAGSGAPVPAVQDDPEDSGEE